MNNDFINNNIQDIIVERDGYKEQVEEQQQEIDRLNNDYKILKELQMKTNEENNRLNNIIDELEKWLNEVYEYLLFTDTRKILRNSKEQMDKYGYFHDLGSINDVVGCIERVRERLKQLKQKNEKLYDFNYKIIWDTGSETIGNITNSELPPESIFLNDKITYFSRGTCTYFNSKKIRQIEIYNLVEKVENRYVKDKR